MENLKQLRELMAQHSLDGLAVVPGPNMTHITKSKFHLSERPVVFFILQNEATFILPELESPKHPPDFTPIRKKTSSETPI